MGSPHSSIFFLESSYNGVVKVNFDAFETDSHIVGFGFVTRDHEGEILTATTASLFDVFSPVIAEA